MGFTIVPEAMRIKKAPFQRWPYLDSLERQGGLLRREIVSEDTIALMAGMLLKAILLFCFLLLFFSEKELRRI